MHRPALVDVAVDVVGVHAGVAQLEQVEQHAVVLVDRRRARVDRHLGLGLDAADGVGRQHVRGEEVVEDAVGVGHGHAPPGRARPLDPAHEHHDVGLVDRHPAPAVGRQRRARPARRGGRRRRASPGRSQNSSPSHHGWVKWCSVTMGSRPRAVHRREDLGVALERGLVEGARASARAGPIPPRAGRRCSRWPRRGPAPPRGGARSRRPARTARPGRCPPSRDQLLWGSPSPLKPPSIW